MAGITPAQVRKIHVLAKERAMDDDLLHAYIQALVGKDSIKYLSITEGITVIDRLSGRKPGEPELATAKQKYYINGLLKQLEWIDIDGQIEIDRYRAFLKKRFHVEHEKLSKEDASNVIEALKDMITRKMEVC